MGPRERGEDLDHQDDAWSSSYPSLSLECDLQEQEEHDPIIEARGECPGWPDSVSSSPGDHRLSPPWNSSREKKGLWFQPEHQTGQLLLDSLQVYKFEESLE